MAGAQVVLFEACLAHVRVQPVAPEGEQVARDRFARRAFEPGAAIEARGVEACGYGQVVAALELLEVLAVQRRGAATPEVSSPEESVSSL